MFLFFLSNLLLNKKGPTPPLTVFLAQLMLLFFYSFFVFVFRRPFFGQWLSPKALKMKAPKQLKIIKNSKNVMEMHPQSGHVKRISPAGAKPPKLTTLTTLSAVFPKAQSSQSRAKMEAKIKSSGTQNHEKPATRAPQKNTKSRTWSPFWRQKRNIVSRLFGSLFEPWAALEHWSLSLPWDFPRPYF